MSRSDINRPELNASSKYKTGCALYPYGSKSVSFLGRYKECTGGILLTNSWEYTRTD